MESVGIDRIWPVVWKISILLTMIRDLMCVTCTVVTCCYGFHPICWGRCRKWVIFLVSEAKGIHTHPTTSHLSGCKKCGPRRVGKHIWDVGYFDFGHQWLALGFARRAAGTPQAFRTRWEKPIGRQKQPLRPHGRGISVLGAITLEAWRDNHFMHHAISMQVKTRMVFGNMLMCDAQK